MADSAGEKTEAATPRRRAKAREEGNIARSPDLTAAFMMLGGFVLLFVFSERVFVALRATTQQLLAGDPTTNPTRTDGLGNLLTGSLQTLTGILAPLLLLLLAIGMITTVAQVGFLLTGKPIVPKFSKLNPLNGVKQMLGMRGFMRFVQNLLKLLLIGAVGWFMVARNVPKVLMLARMELVEAMTAWAWLVFELALVLAVVVLLLAFFDYVYQRWQHEKDLRMTKEDVKNELKDMDGDPLVKQRRARVARQLALQRIGAAVPKADVIVTNPTHYAIALQYDAATMRAPKVIAKGADFLALRIRQLAALHGVPTIERKPLARALYDGVEVGQEVPAEHYAAVAELLAYVYRLSGKAAA